MNKIEDNPDKIGTDGRFSTNRLPGAYPDLAPDGFEKNGGCWKMFRCKASEILRNEAYFYVRRSDEE
jgi:hypothetical protein